MRTWGPEPWEVPKLGCHYVCRFTMIAARRRSSGRKHFRREYDKKVRQQTSSRLSPSSHRTLDAITGARRSIFSCAGEHHDLLLAVAFETNIASCATPVWVLALSCTADWC